MGVDACGGCGAVAFHHSSVAAWHSGSGVNEMTEGDIDTFSLRLEGRPVAVTPERWQLSFVLVVRREMADWTNMPAVE